MFMSGGVKSFLCQAVVCVLFSLAFVFLVNREVVILLLDASLVHHCDVSFPWWHM